MVISTVDTPNTQKFLFVVSDGELDKGAFVEARSEDGSLIGMITSLVKANRYFERADSVKSFEKSGASIAEQLPAGEWEYLVAEVKALSVHGKGLQKRPSKPVSPGTEVFLAGEQSLRRLLGFDFDNGLKLGELEHHALPVSLSLDKLLRKHLAILSISGGGKSYAASCLLEELLDRPPEKGRVAVVLLDVHGEYTSLAQPPTSPEFKDYSRSVRVVDAGDVRIGVSHLSPSMLEAFASGVSRPQSRALYKVISSLRKADSLAPFDLEKVRLEVEASESVKEGTKGVLLSMLDQLDSLGLFSSTDAPSVRELAVPGRLSIIDFSKTVDLRKKRFIVAHVARALFEERRKGRIPPFLLVVEEAHQFAPERVAGEMSVAKQVLENIAREGRKFGACLCLITQRPVQLATTVLSQCNTNLILRVTNPYDLKHIGESCEGLDSDAISMITTLRTGEGLLVGEAVSFPLFFKVRRRRSQESPHSKSLEDIAKEFESARGAEREDVKAFV